MYTCVYIYIYIYIYLYLTGSKTAQLIGTKLGTWTLLCMRKNGDAVGATPIQSIRRTDITASNT